MTFNRNLLSEAVRYGLAAGAVGILGTIAAPAAIAQESAATLDRIEVTGSRIKRAEVEGPSPITVISREDIDVSGELSVADFLRNNVYNSFGSTRESSGSATGSQATINLRGIGSVYTLVLLDGRRMTSSPTLSGGAQNINLIPMAAVERIEILREGAGAIYGSDAIGGVINVILRKDYEGMVVSGGIERPTGAGPDARNAAIAGGISSERGNITFSVDHQGRDQMYNRDIRDKIPAAWWTAGLSTFTSAANLFVPGVGVLGAPNCANFENNIFVPALNRCNFDHGATSANESSLSRDSLMVNGNYRITDNTSFFFRGVSSDTRSLGVYASAPVDTFPTISATNPFNPHGQAGTLYYRFTPLGTRDSVRRDSYRDVSFGLDGSNDWFGGADWEMSVTHGRVRQSSVNFNYGIGSVLQELIDSGEFNPFNPNHPSVAANAGRIGHTVLVESEQREVGADGHLAFDLFDLPAGSVGFVTGFEYRDNRLSQVYDAQSAAGNVFGSAGAGSGGERASYAVYFESLIPLLDTLSLTVAGRYDSYNDFGSKFSPRVSLEFRPLDSLLVRGSWGQGFRAPTLADLYGDNSTTNLNSPPVSTSTPAHPGGDELACAALTAERAASGNATYQPYPVNPCTTTGQYQWLVTSNPGLQPEESKNWGMGVVFSPTDSVSVALDYWDITLENIIGTIPRALAFRLGDAGTDPNYGVTRTPSFVAPGGTVMPGAPQQILLPIDNGAERRARGVDLDATYRLSTAAAGNYTVNLAVSRQLQYDFTPKGAGTIEQAGTAGFPKTRGQLTLGWEHSDFSAALITNYIAGSTNGTAASTLPSWTTYDLQASWATPFNSKVSIGVRNLTDKDPPFNNSLYGFPFYSNSLYNIYGRVPYMRYEQRF